jgi:hypothetical protein
MRNWCGLFTRLRSRSKSLDAGEFPVSGFWFLVELGYETIRNFTTERFMILRSSTEDENGGYIEPFDCLRHTGMDAGIQVRRMRPETSMSVWVPALHVVCPLTSKAGNCGWNRIEKLCLE